MMPTLAAVLRSLIWVSAVIFSATNLTTQLSGYRLLAKVLKGAQQKIRTKPKTS